MTPYRPTLAATSPACPESAKTASSPRDAPSPGRRSQLARILNVPRLENKLSRQLGRAGEKCSPLRFLLCLRPCKDQSQMLTNLTPTEAALLTFQ